MIHLVTTCSPDGWRVYGRNCLESLVEYWPPGIKIYLFVESPLDKYESLPISDDRVTVLNLTDETAISEFFADFGWHENMRGGPLGTDYRLQGGRFAHKIFALTADCLPKTGFRIWIDADTETFAPVDYDWIWRCLPAEIGIASYLGRTDWHHSECGFVAYDLDHKGGDFLRDFLELYVSGRFLSYRETHDSFIFDRLRDKYVKMGYTAGFKNLSPNAKGLDVWPQSVLGERMRHFKGNAKFWSANAPSLTDTSVKFRTVLENLAKR